MLASKRAFACSPRTFGTTAPLDLTIGLLEGLSSGLLIKAPGPYTVLGDLDFPVIVAVGCAEALKMKLINVSMRILPDIEGSRIRTSTEISSVPMLYLCPRRMPCGEAH